MSFLVLALVLAVTLFVLWLVGWLSTCCLVGLFGFGLARPCMVIRRGLTRKRLVFRGVLVLVVDWLVDWHEWLVCWLFE